MPSVVFPRGAFSMVCKIWDKSHVITRINTEAIYGKWVLSELVEL